MSISEILKKEGLDLAEDVSIAAVKAVLNALPAILRASPSKLDDLLIPILGIISGPILSLLDKIDGKEG